MGYKIIIIEDNQANQELIGNVLTRIDPSGVVDFDGHPYPISTSELLSCLAKSHIGNQPEQETGKKIQNAKEVNEVLLELMTRSGNMPFAIILIKANGELEWCNDGFEQLHGFALGEYRELFGNSVFGLDPSSGIGQLFSKCLQEAHAADCICQVKSKKGEIRWLQLFINPLINEQGLVEELFLVEIDITQFKKKELELNAQNRKMKEVMRNLEHLNALLETQKQEIDQQKQTIEEEQEKSEKLLLNILPFEVARQLKSKGKAGTRQYKLVSVIFADFKGFSRLSKSMDPKDLVSILDSYFATFDEITGRHYIEKIKTIGDAYMCAGGLPLSNKSNPIDAVLAGLEIQNYLNKLNDSKVLNNLPVWELRLGIHTGPVVAGVVGKKRFAYDIWGDTVNIASRMEQSGHVGMVNISGSTYEYIKDFFDCDNRGKIETKNMGKIDMYFVNRIKPEYSIDNLGILPNEVMINMVNKL